MKVSRITLVLGGKNWTYLPAAAAPFDPTPFTAAPESHIAIEVENHVPTRINAIENLDPSLVFVSMMDSHLLLPMGAVRVETETGEAIDTWDDTASCTLPVGPHRFLFRNDSKRPVVCRPAFPCVMLRAGSGDVGVAVRSILGSRPVGWRDPGEKAVAHACARHPEVFRGDRLAITESHEDLSLLDVSDLQVGNCLQWANFDRIPASIFGRRNSLRFDMMTASTHQDITLRLVNRAPRARRVRIAIEGNEAKL